MRTQKLPGAKFPGEVLRYEFNWNPALNEDPISGDVSIAVESGGPVEITRVATVDGKTTFWVEAGGAPNQWLYLLLTATTEGGQIVQQRLGIFIEPDPRLS